MAPSLPTDSSMQQMNDTSAQADIPGKGMDREQEKDAKIEELRQRLMQGGEDSLAVKAGAQLAVGGEIRNPLDICQQDYLHKWLRARSWDVDRALSAITKHAEWRAANMPTGKVDEASIANELACEKAYIQGVDRKGRPLMIIQVRKHNGWTRSLDELERFCCYILDKCVALASEHKATNPRGQCCCLLDLTDMGALSMDIQAIKTLFQLLGEHYVERLGAMFFFNPPYIFWGAWNGLSPLLPEPTRNKIKVLDLAQASELLELIDPAVLPKEYGGQAELAPPLGK